MKPAVMTAVALAFGLSTARAEDTIRFAVAGPVTGPAAGIGEDMKAGADTARDRINAEGGILGKKLELFYADDMNMPEKAVSAANTVAAEQIQFVVGHYRSAATIPASKVYNENGIVQVTISQGVEITQQNFANIFRITPNAVELAAGYMSTIKTEYSNGNSSIAIIGTNDRLAKDLSFNLEKNIRAANMTVAMLDHYSEDDKDFSAIITKMKMRSINLVLLSGSEQQMGLIVRQSAGQGFYPQFIVSSTALSSDFASVAGGCNAKGVKSVAAWNPLYTPGADNEALLADLHKHGANSADTAINVYSAVMAMEQAIEQAGSADPAKVAETLHKGTFSLPIGEIQFTATGELAKPRAIVYEFQSDKTPCQTVYPRPYTP